jgi:hypothetical protein
VLITDDQSGTAGVPATNFTFTFSEAVAGFNASSVGITSGSAGTFTADAGGKVYHLAVTADPFSAGNCTVSVAANAVSDLAGNTNVAAVSDVQPYSSYPTSLSLGSVGGYNLYLDNFFTVNGRTYGSYDPAQNNSVVINATANVMDAIFNGGSDTTATQATGAVKGVDDARTVVVGGYTIVLPTVAELQVIYAARGTGSVPIFGNNTALYGNGAYVHAADLYSAGRHYITPLSGGAYGGGGSTTTSYVDTMSYVDAPGYVAVGIFQVL